MINADQDQISVINEYQMSYTNYLKNCPIFSGELFSSTNIQVRFTIYTA